MTNLILLSSSFPYEGGEQFLETEIKFFKKTGFDNIYIIPSKCKGDLRSLPSNIKVIKTKERNNIIYIFFGFFNLFFYREILYIIKFCKVGKWINCFAAALKATALTLREKNKILTSLKKIDAGNNIVYSYWNDASFYAACILKKEGVVDKVISRAHGGDLYEERRNNYMPLKRQYMNDFDMVYLLSEKALKYYNKTYGANLNKLAVSKLGVDMPVIKPGINLHEKKIKILSISYCVELKQIDKIMDAVFQYSKTNNKFVVEWTHIGNGPLYEKLQERAIKLAKVQENLSIIFLGYLDNIDVKKQLKLNYYDVFINASQSEGIPVSIMEAMSYGIPAIAPDIGGISDLVNEFNGCLMRSDFNTNDIVENIDGICGIDVVDMYRDNSRRWIAEKFNASLNYPQFVEEIERLVGIDNKI